jgi:hypothetical protein
MLVSTLHVLSFPTVMAAMTGYLTAYEPYIEDYDGNLMRWDKVRPLWVRNPQVQTAPWKCDISASSSRHYTLKTPLYELC